MNEATLRKEMLTDLGDPIVCVEAKQQVELIRASLNEAYRWFSAYCGFQEIGLLPLIVGVNEYPLPSTVLDVLEVNQPQTLDASFADYGFLGGFGGVYVGGLIYGGASQLGRNQGAVDPYPYSGVYQGLDMNENIAKLFGAEFEWEVQGNAPNKLLIVHPIPAAAGTIQYKYTRAITDITELQDGSREQDIVIRYAKAELKYKIGRVRRKFDSLPGTDGEISLDGDLLLEEAREEKEKLDELIRELAMPMKFIAQ